MLGTWLAAVWNVPCNACYVVSKRSATLSATQNGFAQGDEGSTRTLLSGWRRSTPTSHTCLPCTWPQCEEVLPQDPESNKYKPNLWLEGTERASLKKVRAEGVSYYEGGAHSSQKVLRCTARMPSSSYSRLETHMRLNVSREARMEPPIQVE